MNDHDDRLHSAMAATEAAAQFESRRFSLPKAHNLLGVENVTDIIEQIITERKENSRRLQQRRRRFATAQGSDAAVDQLAAPGSRSG